ncbi:phytanoyl-CoA dioxygenase family protein [Aurantibacter crassamenti]|uniref:phytanoyl-CoA dioxygenase family protein n=1 Tax=Aurantibacter crassamenti TaxID=1837375 RepID=UPI001939631B|nr:phytanoyl-CoA dioxygenase family protein [Aurantibacter crassamenti]MBM1107125.1 phytanoyl-CoA dioxygenase family protein [Aurantibacter crassamenti]
MLSTEELKTLDRDGYVSLGQLLSNEQVKAINDKIDELLQIEGENAGSELFESKYIRHPKEEGADRLADLVNKGAIFDVFYTHNKVLAGITAVLGEHFKLSSLNYRAAKPGLGHQKLHVDYGNSIVDGHYKVCNTIWLLDDFVENNGATRIVPGTHKSKLLPNEVMKDVNLAHPDQVLIQAPAGSVYIFNSHVWHGGTTNYTNKYRRSIHSYFCAQDQPQQLDQKKYITEETRNRLDVKYQKVLDVL